MRLSITHRTRYEFDEPVVHGLQRLRLTPKSTSGQEVVNWEMEYDGAREQLGYEDHNCNTTVLVEVDAGVKHVEISCRGIVDTNDQSGIIGHHAGHLPLWHFNTQTDLTRPGPGMRALTDKVSGNDDTLQTLHALSAAILEKVHYVTGRTTSQTTATESLEAGTGVCQDHAHIFLGCARLMQVPARYVSGYLMMNDRIDQEAGHAWAEAFVKGLGWVGFDISNQISPDARYVRVATGRDYREAAPITGISTGGRTDSMTVELAVAQQMVDQ